MGQAIFQRVTASVALLAAALWLGGLVALGAITAPIVFAVTPFPQSADAMTLVFRRFDLVAMSCAVLVLSGEAVRAAGRSRAAPFGRADWVRAGVCALAAAAAVGEGTLISPRIAALHAVGAIRGVGAAGTELSHLHDWAERCGKTQVALLAALVVLSAWQGWASSPARPAIAAPRVDGRSPGP